VRVAVCLISFPPPCLEESIFFVLLCSSLNRIVFFLRRERERERERDESDNNVDVLLLQEEVINGAMRDHSEREREREIVFQSVLWTCSWCD
jgi:hypothetical protein